MSEDDPTFSELARFHVQHYSPAVKKWIENARFSTYAAALSWKQRLMQRGHQEETLRVLPFSYDAKLSGTLEAVAELARRLRSLNGLEFEEVIRLMEDDLRSTYDDPYATMAPIQQEILMIIRRMALECWGGKSRKEGAD